MKKKAITIVLFILALSLAIPFGAHSFAVTSPIASNDSYSVNENNILGITANGILSNDTPPSGKTLSAVLVGNVQNGVLNLNSNGNFIYIPNTSFHGSDSFRYFANDGQSSSNIATVTITVNAANNPPIAKDDSFAADENATLNKGGKGVLANDTDADGNTITASVVTAPQNGALVLNPNGSFTYSPHSNFHGLDSFSYKANDGIANSNVATVSITVNQITSSSSNNPIFQLIAQIQNLFSKLAGLEQKINTLQEKNDALEKRVTQLEKLIPVHGTNATSISNGEHDDDEKDNDDNGNHGNHGNSDNPENKGEHGNQNKQNENND